MPTPIKYECNAYKSNLSTISTVLNAVNTVNLTDELKTYLLGKTLTQVNTNLMLGDIKLQKGMALPNFQQYLEAGLNLADSVPDNPATISALKELTEKFKYSASAAQYISYTVSGWAINSAGSTYLDSLKVVLTTKQTALLTAVKALHTQLSQMESPGYSFKTIFSEELIGFNGEKFLEIDLVDKIKNFNN